jgi:hypothetical protein
MEIVPPTGLEPMSRTSAQYLNVRQRKFGTIQLEKGHVQGDAPSPLLYNMAAQICIWKVELDPGITSVYDPSLRQNPDPNNAVARGPDPVRVQSAEVYGNESNREKTKMSHLLTMQTILRYYVTTRWQG